MKKLINIVGRVVLSLCVVLLALSSCTKNDIQPAPVGEPVPYNGPDKTWQQLLAQSPYTIFRAAWQRSHMDTALVRYGSTYYTFFIPTDKAFQDAGWTADRINATAAEKLDTLLANCTAAGRYLPDNLAVLIGSQALRTLATRSDLPNYNSWDPPYTGFLFVAKHGDSLLVNGNAMNKWGTGTEGKNGMIYPVNKMILRPEMTMWQYLESDERFSLFTAAVLINDSLYQSAYMGQSALPMLQSMARAPQTTLFAPTDDAFRKNGFMSVDDIRNYCLRSWPLEDPYVGPDGFFHVPVTAMDSILYPHGLEMCSLATYNNNSGPIFFSNDLLDIGPKLDDLILVPGSAGNYPTLTMSLSFSTQNGAPMVKRFGSLAAPTGLVEKDIRVTNGVIHAVDQLFMP